MNSSLQYLQIRVKTGVFLLLLLLIFYPQQLDARPKNSVELKNEGLRLIREQKFSDAARIFGEALVKDEHDVELRYLRAAAYYSDKDYNRAQRELQRILTLDPANVRAEAMLKSILELKAAENAPPLTVTKNPTLQVQKLIDQAEQELASSNQRQALALFEEAIVLAPDNYPVLLQLTKIYDRMGNEKSAMHYFDQLVNYHGGKPEIYPLLSEFLSRSVKTNKALRIIEEYRKNGGDKIALDQIRTTLYIKSGEFNKAESDLVKKLRKDPKDVETLKLLAQIYRATGNERNYIDTLKALKTITDNNAAIVMELSEAYEKAGIHDYAFKTMMDIPPEKREDNYFRRLIILGKRAGENALVGGAYERLISSTADSVNLKEEYVDFLISIEQTEKAMDKISLYLRENPGQPAMIKRLKNLAIRSGNEEITFRALQQYLELFPNSRSTRIRLVKLSKKLGRTVNLPPTEENAPLQATSDKEFNTSLLALKTKVQGTVNTLLARINYEILIPGKQGDKDVVWCNIRALHRLLNEIYMLPSEAEQYISCHTILELFSKKPINGVVLFIQYRPEDNGTQMFSGRVITVSATSSGAADIRQEGYLLPNKPFIVTLPDKVIYDNELPILAGKEEYDQVTIERRYASFTEILSRVEVERKTLLRDLLERVDSRNPADLMQSMEMIQALLALEGIKPIHLTVFTRALQGSINDELEITLLEELEKTTNLLFWINNHLQAISDGLLGKLNRNKTEDRRKKILEKHFKKNDPIWKALDLKE